MQSRIPALVRAAVLAAACLSAAAAHAQAWPAKPVKFVMPAAPGSSPDRVARLIAERVGTLWGQPVIVENRPGGTGTVGSEYVARLPADGYTALFAFTSVIQAPALLPKVPYDIERDFAPVTLAVRVDAAKVDVAIVSLTAPNAHFGAPGIALQAAAVMNDSMAAAQLAYPDRIRWFASLPWLHAELALAELERACAAGAVGVMVIANIEGRPLTARKLFNL
ncbi:MAG: hypothetical protein EXR27_08630 [Betaproteobacteria bacterium]|nr:hypothetical protein [Betaproteobacteria bacterium]